MHVSSPPYRSVRSELCGFWPKSTPSTRYLHRGPFTQENSKVFVFPHSPNPWDRRCVSFFFQLYEPHVAPKMGSFSIFQVFNQELRVTTCGRAWWRRPGLTLQTQQKGPVSLWKRNQKCKTGLLTKGPPHVLQNPGLLGHNLLPGARDLWGADATWGGGEEGQLGP